MHNPYTLAFEIKNPFSGNENSDSIITIWHVDPCKDGKQIFSIIGTLIQMYFICLNFLMS